MILIADSGSTKTEWRLLIPDQPTQIVLGTGINPFYQSDLEIVTILKMELHSFQNVSIQNIYFYGAGCQTVTKKQIVKQALQAVFQGVRPQNIWIETDVLAAARSLAGTQKGLIGILGTGANVNFYDGKDFPNYQSGLGFLLGDEGSGADLGREVVRHFLRQELPDNLQDSFEKKYTLNRDELIQGIYQAKFPNRYLANFTFFLAENLDCEFVQDLLAKRFDIFFRKMVCSHDNYRSYPLFMLGSIVFYFQEIFMQIADNHTIKIEKIIKTPIENLEIYHQQNFKR